MSSPSHDAAEDDNGTQHDDISESDVSEYLTPQSHPSSPTSSIRSDVVRASSPRKRKRTQGRAAEAKRLKLSVDQEYRSLLNEEILDARYRYGSASANDLAGSQIGVSTWTASEKNIFFNALAKVGRHDCSKIASAIGSKSELEVRSYLLLLQEGLAEVRLSNPRSLLRFRDIPAAAEISEACCERLEELGDALCQDQEALDAKKETQKCGSLWLLDPDAAHELESWYTQESQSTTEASNTQDERTNDMAGLDDSQARKPQSGDETASNALGALPAARLLKFCTWLELSSRVFMNSSDPSTSTNWRLIAESGEEPSIYHTAFADFYRLAVGLTQRLVQATLFQAMSRLRATAASNTSTVRRSVHLVDVHAALDILGMKKDAKDFWITAARRCRLAVYYDLPRKSATSDCGPPLQYAEVERLLSRRDSVDESRINEREELTDDGLQDSESSDSPPDAVDEIEEDESDFEADLLDQEASRAEEQRLWDMIGQEPPTGAAQATTNETSLAEESQVTTAEGGAPIDEGDAVMGDTDTGEKAQFPERSEDEQ